MGATGLFIGEVPNIEIRDGIVRFSIFGGDRVYCVPVGTARASVEMLRRLLADWDTEQKAKIAPCVGCQNVPPGNH